MTDWFEISNPQDVPSPALLIYPDRVCENLQRMIRMTGDPAKLRPHVKTHKLPQIIALKRSVGIEKFKTSTIAEAEMVAGAGGEDVLLAYPCVGPNAVRLARLVQTYPKTRFSTLFDCRTNLEELSAAAQSCGVTIGVMIDLNVGMNRTGIEPGDAAAELYRSAAACEGLNTEGVHAYDGHLRNIDKTTLRQDAERMFQRVQDFVASLRREGAHVPRIVVGGTPTSSILAGNDDVEVGAGTTVLWDFGQPEISPDLDYLNAAVLLARVISRPAADLITLDLGYKAVASEMPHPRVRWFGLEDADAVMQSEEHLVLRTDRSEEYPVGRVVYGIPRHICPTVALFGDVWCVRNQQAVHRWPVVARARSLNV